MATEIDTGEKTELVAFEEDTQRLGQLTADFIEHFYPAYGINPNTVKEIPKENSLEVLNAFTFYKVCDCKIYDVENRFAFFAERMQKLFTTAYSIKREVCYGIVSSEGDISILIGVASEKRDDYTIKTIISGLFPGIRMEKYTQKFKNQKDSVNVCDKDQYIGCISGVPSLKINGVYQNKDLSPLMRSLNGFNYTMMVMCKPIDTVEIQSKIDQAVSIQDQCFAISKRTISLQQGNSNADAYSNQYNEVNGEQTGTQKGVNVNGTFPGMAAGAAVGAAVGSIVPGLGTAVGAVAGGLFALLVGQQVSINRSRTEGTNHSISKGYSEAVTRTISENKSIAGDIQNGFAIDLMKMAEAMATRLKIGRSIGMWESVVSYSSDSELARDIIQGSLYREMASGLPEVLPPITFAYTDTMHNAPLNKIHNEQLLIPKGFFDNVCDSPLCSFVTSEELCGICPIPVENTVGFEIQESKGYALNYAAKPNDILIGKVCEYERPLENVPFGLSDDDLNKHTFVCGITGSGKTNTIKKILMSIDKPFLVIEPAKKEYRNIKLEKVNVYTLGRPEINCLKMNPFYIPMGISPQQHIDMLKDLFSASFAFYGPMPYIMEKCLNRIYEKKGWNLTLGFHPYLINSETKNPEELFDVGKMDEHYKIKSHRYLFPTMEDLKKEIDYFINNEMNYEGEVKGNIQSAMKARIESLCVGSKGYMFNTNDVLDLEKLLENNSVLELEGLADDADKAFALGLLIIYVNEYRQVTSEIDKSGGLRHLLVIEEAHRLLTNVSLEKNEDLGNPKGKAVEHFSNMLAEMRSYGQGVIVAEQIPGKLAPDVIKNSSNKIVHRIVAKDDQDVIANTIGVYPQDAIYLGNSKVGYALCHKEGMVQPVIVKIDKVKSNRISDAYLYAEDLENKLFEINKSIIETEISDIIDVWAVKALVSIMRGVDSDALYEGLEKAYDILEHTLFVRAITLVPCVNKKECVLQCITEKIVSRLSSGVFSNRKMPDNSLVSLIEETILTPEESRLFKLSERLTQFYNKNPGKKAVEVVAGLVSDEYAKNIDVRGMIQDFVFFPDSKLADDVVEYLRGR